jgi:hypothetical protein
VTQADRPKRRDLKVKPYALERLAAEPNLEVWQPERVTSAGLIAPLREAQAVLILATSRQMPLMPSRLVPLDGPVLLRIAKGGSACPHGLAATFGRDSFLPCPGLRREPFCHES